MERAPSPVPQRDPRERALARTLGIPDLAARVLLRRGIDDLEGARAYLRPDLRSLGDPFAFTAMARSVERIQRAIRDGERIMVHGDYDVDGVTGTVLLVKFFGLMSADVRAFIPAREDGYSLTAASVAAVRERGVKLLISVDNGTNAVDAVDAIQQGDCDVIVTDHHGTSEGVARAFAVLNPRLPGAGYPDHDLAGVGVAFKLATAVARSFSRGKSMSDEFRGFLVEAMAYVALGTVADVAPLRGENRVMVHHGLRALAASRNPGIRALLDAAGIGDRALDTEDISYRIGPLINAAGRMGSALEAVELLTAPGYQEAQRAAAGLEKHNDLRRKIERELFDAVIAAAEALGDRIVVLGGDGWHRGVLGIVAARVAERLAKPTLLIGFERSGFGRGSGRSARGFDLRAALAGCADTMLSYGGHHAAVGLEIERGKLPELRARINEVAARTAKSAWQQQVDGTAAFRELSTRDVRSLDQLGPFGSGNPRPTFSTAGARIVGLPTVDPRGQDLRFRLVHDGVILPARLHRGAAEFEAIRTLSGRVTVCYSPRLAQWADEGPVPLHAWSLEPDDLRPSPPLSQETAAAAQKPGLYRRFYDWVLHWAYTPYAQPALALVAFTESSFFLIPPDVLLLPMCLGDRQRAFRFALLCSVMSVLGGMFGYWLGAMFWDAGLRDLAYAWIHGFDQQSYEKIAALYERWNFWVVFVAGFSPIPYKLFTVAGGVCKIDFTMFVIASAVSRSARFFLEALLLRIWGQQIRDFVEKRLGLMSLLFCVLLVGGFAAVKYAL